VLPSVKFAEDKVLVLSFSSFSVKKMLKWCNSETNPNRNPNFQSRVIRYNFIGVVSSNGTLFSINLMHPS